MPRFDLNQDNETFQPKTGSIAYSAVSIGNLEENEYTLATMAVDCSSSVRDFKNEIELCIGTIIRSLKDSPRSENFLLRLMGFTEQVFEIHGYKELSECNPDEYINSLTIGGMTAARDATMQSLDPMIDYAERLVDQDYKVNGLLYLLTDGADNSSSHASSPSKIKARLHQANSDEKIESVVMYLVGINSTKNANLTRYLTDMKNDCGFHEYIEIGSEKSDFNALAGWASKSASTQSRAVGSGAGAVTAPLSIT